MNLYCKEEELLAMKINILMPKVKNVFASFNIVYVYGFLPAFFLALILWVTLRSSSLAGTLT